MQGAQQSANMVNQNLPNNEADKQEQEDTNYSLFRTGKKGKRKPTRPKVKEEEKVYKTS